jgi:hypothetical protein
MDKIHIRIGSAIDNQLVIENSGIDPYHLELFSDPNGNVFITDLNTKNGTYVNGRLLDGFTMLTFGDKVVLGQHHLFRWESYMQEKSNAKKSQENNRTEEIPYYSTAQNKKVNIQIIIIYFLITVILLVMAFLID